LSLSDQLAKEIMEGKGDKLISAIAYKLMIDPDFTKAIVNKLLKDLATKEDIEKLEARLRELATKQELFELRKEIAELMRTVATKNDLRELEARLNEIEKKMATGEELKEFEVRVNEIEGKMATKEDIQKLETRLNGIERNMATKEDLEKLRKEVKEDINELRNTFNTMLKWIIGLLTTMWVSIVVGIIIALIKLK